MKERRRRFAVQASTSSCRSTSRKQKLNTPANSRSAMLWKVSLIVSFLCGLLSLQELSWAQDLRRIHYGTTNSTSHLPVWIAKDAGYFATNGLNVEPVQIRGGALITMGIMSGKLQL